MLVRSSLHCPYVPQSLMHGVRYARMYISAVTLGHASNLEEDEEKEGTGQTEVKTGTTALPKILPVQTPASYQQIKVIYGNAAEQTRPYQRVSVIIMSALACWYSYFTQG